MTARAWVWDAGPAGGACRADERDEERAEERATAALEAALVDLGPGATGVLRHVAVDGVNVGYVDLSARRAILTTEGVSWVAT